MKYIQIKQNQSLDCLFGKETCKCAKIVKLCEILLKQAKIAAQIAVVFHSQNGGTPPA